MLTPGSASAYETGTWRAEKPVIDQDKCIKCGICDVFCPEACITVNEQGEFEVNLYYCKGCGICARECWVGAITMEAEK
ncbi:NAD(P)H-quinone oxidoreductase subunit I, chloroplastic [subsurface metagenome]|nr:4Fe-4S dicluster domain-containing protein [Hadesarchaea archaeon]